jgi:TonB-linked SusC/RagA family outer membrane protein
MRVKLEDVPAVASRRTFRFVHLLALGASLAFASAAAAQQTGRVTGRVTDVVSGAPLEGARVLVNGTTLATGTSANGSFTLSTVPAGTAEIRILRLGYQAQRRTVTVTAGETATLDVAMPASAVQLEGVTVTVTGEQERMRVGNAVSTIQASEIVATGPVANMSDLMVAKAPGIQVLPGAITGAGQRIRIRGTNSLSLNNEPIVIVDGIRVTSDNNASSIGIGGTNASRFSDLNPEEIESIEIVKGPSAATLYGTDAANGVIVITTKKGSAGPPKWTAYTEYGQIRDLNDYPIAYRGWRTGTTAATTSTPTNAVYCFLADVAAGRCTQDSVSTYNLFKDPDASPLGTGERQQYGLQVAGGTEAVRYFLSGEWEDETGYLQMPRFAASRVRAIRGEEPLSEQFRPNGLRKTSLRANLQTDLSSKADISVSTGFITSNQRLPQTDNNTTGLLSNAFGGPGNKTNGRFGYRAFTPDEFFSETVSQAINRFIGGSTANYRPFEWLAITGTAGIDFTSRNESDICRRDQCVDFGTTKTGFKTNNRTEYFNYTANLNGSANFQPLEQLSSRTSAGLQFNRDVFARNGASAEDLTPGGTQVSAGSIPSAEESYDASKTLGGYLEQEVGWREVLFVTGALRTDRNSAFGQDFDAVIYPKLSASWIASDERFFPTVPGVSNLRLRAAYGQSGTQPGLNDAIRYFSATTASIADVDVPAITFTSLGNPDLKPERARELELGFDAGFFNQRLSVEVTHYDKLTQDALVSRIVAPSAGAASTRFENLGSVSNRGWEVLVNALVFERPAASFDVTFSGSHNTNRLEKLGKNVPAIVGATTQQREGYPIDGYWQRPILGFADTNGDKIISLSEIQVGDTNVFIGSSTPINEMTANFGLDLFRKTVRVSALLDRKTGHYLLNGTERIRCESRSNCRGAMDPTAPLWEQARAVAVREHASRTQAGFMEKADFTRLREVSATFYLPGDWAARAGAERLSITAAARNLHIWTDYTGLDPESNYFSGARGTVSDFQTAPPPSYFTFRLNVGF